MNFPYLSEDQYFHFPPVEDATPEGIVASGGNLSPGMLLSAYKQGIFPWYEEWEAILWWSPDPRFILRPDEIIVSRSMAKILKRQVFQFTVDKDFPQVIRNCQSVPRKKEKGTWITTEMLEAYIKLHELGYAHSVEAWKNDELTGGIYGISLGSCFFGESMFSFQSNASKAVLIVLSRMLADACYSIIDCQVYTKHLDSMGAKMIPRKDFIAIINKGLKKKTITGNWPVLLKNAVHHAASL